MYGDKCIDADQSNIKSQTNRRTTFLVVFQKLFEFYEPMRTCTMYPFDIHRRTSSTCTSVESILLDLLHAFCSFPTTTGSIASNRYVALYALDIEELHLDEDVRTFSNIKTIWRLQALRATYR